MGKPFLRGWRRIMPNSIGLDGFRWYERACCDGSSQSPLMYATHGDQVTSRARGALLCHSIQRLGPGKEGSERALEQQHIVLLNQKSSIQIYRPETNEKQADRIDGVDSGRMVVANE